MTKSYTYDVHVCTSINLQTLAIDCVAGPQLGQMVADTNSCFATAAEAAVQTLAGLEFVPREEVENFEETMYCIDDVLHLASSIPVPNIPNLLFQILNPLRTHPTVQTALQKRHIDQILSIQRRTAVEASKTVCTKTVPLFSN